MLNRISAPPTAPGARLYERITRMMEELDSAVTEAVATDAGTLRINIHSLGHREAYCPEQADPTEVKIQEADSSF